MRIAVKSMKVLISACYYGLILVPRRFLAEVLGRRRGRTIVLVYHGVRNEERDSFAKQMGVLARAGTPSALLTRWPEGSGHARVCVTFDDGFANLMRNALPILAERRIPATVFVCSGNLGDLPRWAMATDCPDRDQRLMTAAQVGSLDGSRVAVGSHTVSHADLATLADEDAMKELSESRTALEKIVERPVDLLAYPYGRYTRGTAELARRAGYRRACTIDPCTSRCGDESFQMGRFSADPSDWSIEFWLKVRGAYGWLPVVQRLKRRLGGPLRARPAWMARGGPIGQQSDASS